MANINESIEQLTASLQELTTQTYKQAHITDPVSPGNVSVEELQVSEEVESFLERTRAYADKTRNVSVGMY